MFRKIFLVLVLSQMSFALDPSIVKVLGCLEKKRMSVISVEKIDGKIYVKKETGKESDVIGPAAFDPGVSILEYKQDCLFQERDYLKGVKHSQRKGLLGAKKNSTRDSIIVVKKNKAIWSCPLGGKKVENISVLDQSKLVVGCSDDFGERDFIDTLWLLDDKCRWTLFEPNANMNPLGFAVDCTLFHDKFVASSRFLSYYIGKRDPYTVVFDSSWNRHWGTSLSFWVNTSARDVGCGYYYFTDPDDTGQNGWVVKCARWTGNNFVEFTLPYEVRDRNESRPVQGLLFPCGDGICVQDRETKKIEVLVDE